MSLLTIKDLEVTYGHIVALRGISLTVNEGEIVTIIGANGAGKSTTLKAIIGNLRPRRGEILFEGTPTHGSSSHQLVQQGMALVPEGRRIFPSLTVKENLEIGGYTLPSQEARQQRIQELVGLFPQLGERLQQLGSTLSGGEQQMLAIARALMPQPRLLLLDEPSMGLAPLVVKSVMETIADIHQRGTTVLLVEQNTQMALRLADRGYVLETGRVVMEGAGRELLASSEVRRGYLGR